MIVSSDLVAKVATSNGVGRGREFLIHPFSAIYLRRLNMFNHEAQTNV